MSDSEDNEVIYKVSKDILKVLEENKPDVSQNSINTYMSCLRNVANGTKINFTSPKDYIEHYDKVIKYLMTLKPSIRKTKIASIVNVLNSSGEHSDQVSDYLIKYRKQMNKDWKEVEDDYSDQKLSTSQQESYISWDECQKIYKELKADTKNLWKKDHLNPTQFKLLQNYVLASCMMLIPVRRSTDYADFKLRNFDDKTKDSMDNYMEQPKNKSKKARFVFNSYKNSKRLGTQYVEIPNELKKIINDWKSKNPYDYLIVNSLHKRAGREKIYDLLNEIFGKKIGTTLLRHIFVTGKFGNVNLKELEEATHDMGNSEVSRTLKYAQKDTGKEEKKE